MYRFFSGPNVKFDHRRAGKNICVSIDCMTITSDLRCPLRHYFCGSERGLKDECNVLGAPVLMTGILGWGVEIATRETMNNKGGIYIHLGFHHRPRHGMPTFYRMMRFG